MFDIYNADKCGPAFVSVNRLKRRRSLFPVGEWIMDSGAFSTIKKYRGYPEPPEKYAEEIRRWAKCGRLLAAVSQDYMCEDWMLELTGKTVRQHQVMTIRRYDRLLRADTGGVYIMPVLQGYAPADYARHVKMYGRRLKKGMWVGVGSVCKRNSNPQAIEEVLSAIKKKRPDLKLHGFGVKVTAFKSALIRKSLHSADSMAWSFHSRMHGKPGGDIGEAKAFAGRIRSILKRR